MTIFKDKKELINGIISDQDIVLDVGFYGQGVPIDAQNWVHGLLLKKAKEVYGVDVKYDKESFPGNHYVAQSAENIDIEGKKFDVIFAGDLIEHLLNPGLFLDSSKKHLKEGGRLIITTPNTFNLFNLTEKLTKTDPTVNYDHTIYLNPKTIGQMLKKAGWRLERVDYVYTLGVKYNESWKKKLLNLAYKILSLFTPKYIETMAVTASRDDLV